MAIDLRLEGDGVWPDLPMKLQEGKLEYHIDAGLSIACLAREARRGEPYVAIRVDLDDGRVAVVETPMRTFLQLAERVRRRYGGQV